MPLALEVYRNITKKEANKLRLEDIKKIGIGGAGIMGSGMAQIFARFGYKVVIVDMAEEYLEKGKNLISVFNDSLIGEGIMKKEDAEKAVANISYRTDKKAFSDCDLIVEAIIEKMEIKQKFWKEVEEVAKKEAIFATNTSGLSINGISKLLEDKSRFIGMHFWNPAHIIPLVELIRGDETKDELVEELRKLIIKIEKKPVVVQKDAPGFIGNRIQFAVMREAMHIVEDGIASIEDVDTAMKFGPGFRYPIIGPLETADLGGLDTFYYISDYLFKYLSDTHEVPKMLKDRMDKGELGVKAKKGFYNYSEGKDVEAIKRRDRMFFEMYNHIYLSQKINK